MPIIFDQWNSIYVGGKKGRPFEIHFCPHNVEAPWSIHAKRGNGYYFITLRELLSFAAGRAWIEYHMIERYQQEVMQALDRKWDEVENNTPFS